MCCNMNWCVLTWNTRLSTNRLGLLAVVLHKLMFYHFCTCISTIGHVIVSVLMLGDTHLVFSLFFIHILSTTKFCTICKAMLSYVISLEVFKTTLVYVRFSCFRRQNYSFVKFCWKNWDTCNIAEEVKVERVKYLQCGMSYTGRLTKMYPEERRYLWLICKVLSYCLPWGNWKV
jgi:hypothetical protein